MITDKLKSINIFLLIVILTITAIVIGTAIAEGWDLTELGWGIAKEKRTYGMIDGYFRSEVSLGNCGSINLVVFENQTNYTRRVFVEFPYKSFASKYLAVKDAYVTLRLTIHDGRRSGWGGCIKTWGNERFKTIGGRGLVTWIEKRDGVWIGQADITFNLTRLWSNPLQRITCFEGRMEVGAEVVFPRTQYTPEHTGFAGVRICEIFKGSSFSIIPSNCSEDWTNRKCEEQAGQREYIGWGRPSKGFQLFDVSCSNGSFRASIFNTGNESLNVSELRFSVDNIKSAPSCYKDAIDSNSIASCAIQFAQCTRPRDITELLKCRRQHKLTVGLESSRGYSGSTFSVPCY